MYQELLDGMKNGGMFLDMGGIIKYQNAVMVWVRSNDNIKK